MAFAAAGGPKPTLTDPTIEAMGFAGYLAAQFPCGIFKDAILLSFATHLFSQFAVHAFASKFQDRTTTTHHATGTIAYGRFGISAVVNQLHANQPFDDLVHNRLAIAFAEQSFAQRAGCTRGRVQQTQCSLAASVQIIGIFDNGSVSPPSRKTSRRFRLNTLLGNGHVLRRNRIAPQECFGTNHVQALAAPALARVVLAAGAAAALLSLATSAAAASLTAAAAAASPSSAN